MWRPRRFFAGTSRSARIAGCCSRGVDRGGRCGRGWRALHRDGERLSSVAGRAIRCGLATTFLLVRTLTSTAPRSKTKCSSRPRGRSIPGHALVPGSECVHPTLWCTETPCCRRKTRRLPIGLDRGWRSRQLFPPDRNARRAVAGAAPMDFPRTVFRHPIRSTTADRMERYATYAKYSGGTEPVRFSNRARLSCRFHAADATLSTDGREGAESKSFARRLGGRTGSCRAAHRRRSRVAGRGGRCQSAVAERRSTMAANA